MNLPNIEVSPEKLYRMFFAATQSKLLITGIRLGVFDHLSEPKSADQVAETLKSDPTNTEFFLNGLTACGLLEKRKGLFRNSPISQTFLIKGGPTYLGEGFLLQSGMREMMISKLDKLVMEGSTSDSQQKDLHSEEQWGRFAVTMAKNQRAGIAQQMSKIVSELPEFPSFQKMLDLGGGAGIFGIAMVSMHPSMKGVIFDRKPSTEVAKRFIKEYQMKERVDVLPGDYNRDSIGREYDFIWASSTLNFAQPHMELVMNKIYDALNPGGVFINLSEGLTHESTQPDFFVLKTMAWSMLNHPLKAFEQGVIADAMLNAGFKTVKSRTLHTGWGPRDLDIARK